MTAAVQVRAVRRRVAKDFAQSGVVFKIEIGAPGIGRTAPGAPHPRWNARRTRHRLPPPRRDQIPRCQDQVRYGTGARGSTVRIDGPFEGSADGRTPPGYCEADKYKNVRPLDGHDPL